MALITPTPTVGTWLELDLWTGGLNSPPDLLGTWLELNLWRFGPTGWHAGRIAW